MGSEERQYASMELYEVSIALLLLAAWSTAVPVSISMGQDAVSEDDQNLAEVKQASHHIRTATCIDTLINNACKLSLGNNSHMCCTTGTYYATKCSFSSVLPL